MVSTHKITVRSHLGVITKVKMVKSYWLDSDLSPIIWELDLSPYFYFRTISYLDFIRLNLVVILVVEYAVELQVRLHL